MGRSLDLTYSSIYTVMRKSRCCTTRLPAKRVPSCPADMRYSHGLAVRFLAAFYEIVNVEQQLAFRCLIGKQQCEQAFVVRIFHTACSKQIQSVLTQVRRSLFQHATTVVVPPLDESLPVAVLWQVCFFFLDVSRACPNALVRSAMRPVTFSEAASGWVPHDQTGKSWDLSNRPTRASTCPACLLV